MTLEGLYNLKLLDYKINGFRDDLDKLLALLLLPEKENYKPLRVSAGEFYDAYKSEIDEKIAKVEKDFEITPEDIVNCVEAKGICCENYEHDRIWFVYSEGFGSMHWGLWYRPGMSAEEIYEACFKDLENTMYSAKGLRYQKLIEACKKYLETHEKKENETTIPKTYQKNSKKGGNI